MFEQNVYELSIMVQLVGEVTNKYSKMMRE